MLNVTKTTEKTDFCIKTAQFQILTIQNTFKYTTAVIYTGESRKHPRNYGNQWQLKQKKLHCRRSMHRVGSDTKAGILPTSTPL